MNTQNNNAIQVEKVAVKAAVNSTQAFLHDGCRKTFKSIQQAATAMKDVWEKLVFAADDAVCLEWQQSGLNVIERILREELTGWDAQDHLHGACGMLNQTHGDAINLVV